MNLLRWVFGAVEDEEERSERQSSQDLGHVVELPPETTLDKSFQKEQAITPEKESLLSDYILFVSIRSPLDECGSATYRSRMNNEEKRLKLDERIVQRDIRWGDSITVGPLQKESTVIVTLSDGSTISILFPPPLSDAEKKKWDSEKPTFGEAYYLVENAFPTKELRQCLIRWEAIPYSDHTTFSLRSRLKSKKCKTVTTATPPLIYFCLCLYSLYFLYMGGAGGNNVAPPAFKASEFYSLVLPLTLLLGMYVSGRSFLSSMKQSLGPCCDRGACFQARRRRCTKVQFDMDSLLWNIIFVDLSSATDNTLLQERDTGVAINFSPEERKHDDSLFEHERRTLHKDHSTDIPLTVFHYNHSQNRRSHMEGDEEDGSRHHRTLDERKVEKESLSSKDFNKDELKRTPLVRAKSTPRSPTQTSQSRRLSGSGVGSELGSDAIKSTPVLKKTRSKSESKLIVKETPDKSSVSDTDTEIWPFPLPPVGVSLKDYSLQIHPSYWGGWSSPDLSVIKVRGKTYMEDHEKIPATSFLMHNVCVDLLGCAEKIVHVAQRPHSYIQRMAQAGRLDGKTFHLVVNFEMPGHPLHHSIVVYLARGEEPGYETDALLERFINGTDDFRNDTFKFIPRIVSGNWFVEKTVGQTPAIIGRKLTCSYFRDTKLNYLEIDVDVGSSVIGSRLQGLVQTYTTALLIDLSFLLQGTSEDELPERLLGGLRIIKGDLAKCKVVPTEAQEEENRKMKLEKKLQSKTQRTSEEDDDEQRQGEGDSERTGGKTPRNLQSSISTSHHDRS